MSQYSEASCVRKAGQKENSFSGAASHAGFSAVVTVVRVAATKTLEKSKEAKRVFDVFLTIDIFPLDNWHLPSSNHDILWYLEPHSASSRVFCQVPLAPQLPLFPFQRKIKDDTFLSQITIRRKTM